LFYTAPRSASGRGAVVPGHSTSRSTGTSCRLNDHIIDAIRGALLIREEETLDQSDDEVVSLKPVLTDPVFI